MKKPVSEMTSDEYAEYLTSLADDEFMKVVSHDVKKVVAIAHGYISLMRLDIEEDILNAKQIEEYMNEMENMFESSYRFLEKAEKVYLDKYID
ncbi:MAG: hypothetical protein AAFV93_10465 [Chloroflexota bacterium]